MNPSSAHAAYKQNSVLTASPEQLVVMLYDGALKFLARAAAAMRSGQASGAGVALGRTHAILDELLATLDLDQGEIAERLQSIYVFCGRTLCEAHLESDVAKVEQVSKLLRELREASAQIATQGAGAVPAVQATA